MDLVRIISAQDFLNCVLPKNGERSTFIFRDPRSYRDASIEKGGDSQEQETVGSNFTATTENDFLVSCWHCLKDQSVADFFDLHAGDNNVALVSTVEAVEKVVNEWSENYKKKGLFQDFKHGPIVYYDYGEVVMPSNGGLPNYCLDAPFRKPKIYNGKNYEKELEYRFAFQMSSSVRMERAVFYVNPREYVKKIYLNFDLKKLVHQIWSRLWCWDIKFNNLPGKISEIRFKV